DRVDGFNRHVGAVTDDRARLDQVAPRVGRDSGTLLAKSRRYPRPVGRAVNALHRGYHAQLRETRHIGRIEMLRMLDSPAKALAAHVRRLPYALVQVEHLAIGAVADRVRVHLEAMLHGEFGGAF